jgi:hypothetical protein
MFRVEESEAQEASTKACEFALLATGFHAGFLLILSFDREDRGDMFLQNVGRLSMDYTVLYPIRYKSCDACFSSTR